MPVGRLAAVNAGRAQSLVPPGASVGDRYGANVAVESHKFFDECALYLEVVIHKLAVSAKMHLP